MLCQNCEKRSDCKELCQEAENYVSQDHVDDGNIVYMETDKLDYLNNALSYPEMIPPQLGSDEWAIIKKCNLTARQKQCVKKYFFEHMTQAQVAEMLGISQQAVTQHLQAAIAKILVKIPYR